MASKPNPFRSSSLGNMFKKKHSSGYQTWAEEDDRLITNVSPSPGPSRPSPSDGGQETESGVGPTTKLPQGVALAECFYLGAYDMQGREIRGRGCIDGPAGKLWQQTQDDGSRRRRRTVSDDRDTFRPRFVKLVAGTDQLEMRDVYSDQKIVAFPYARISFVGTHPKYRKLFAFIAHETGKKTPSCFAFKCEDKHSACTTAQQLDGVFHQRCRELYAQATSRLSNASSNSSSNAVAVQ